MNDVSLMDLYLRFDRSKILLRGFFHNIRFSLVRRRISANRIFDRAFEKVFSAYLQNLKPVQILLFLESCNSTNFFLRTCQLESN